MDEYDPIPYGWKSEFSLTWRVWNFGFGVSNYGKSEYKEAYIGFGPLTFNVWHDVAPDPEEAL